MKLSKRLTTRERKFAYFYIQLGNATRSAVKAGYSKRSARQIGSKLLTNDNVSKYIAIELKEIKNNAIADSSEILEYLTKVMRGQVTDDYAIGTGKGLYTGKKRPDVNERTKAAEDLYKRYAPIEKAKLRKLKTEANYKAQQVQQNSSSNNKSMMQTERIIKILDKDTKK